MIASDFERRQGSQKTSDNFKKRKTLLRLLLMVETWLGSDYSICE
jgi:hypothetical protein